MMSLRISSLNVRGLGSSGKLNKIVYELNNLRCDVFLLQETHVSCRKRAELFEKLWNGRCFWSFGTGKSAGVAVVFSPNFSGNIICFLTDSDGRIPSLLIDFNTCVLNLVNIYAPNTITDRKAFFSTLYSFFISRGLLLLGAILIVLTTRMISLIVLPFCRPIKSHLFCLCQTFFLWMFGMSEKRGKLLSLGLITIRLRPLESIVFFLQNLSFLKFPFAMFYLVFCLTTILLNLTFHLTAFSGADLVSGILITRFYLIQLLRISCHLQLPILSLKFLVLIPCVIGGIILKLKFVKSLFASVFVNTRLQMLIEYFSPNSLCVLKTARVIHL